MSTHTPGPWEWWTSNSWVRLRRSERGVSTNVLYPAVCRDGQATIDVSAADMALIKAAPDMLHALEMVRDANLEDPHIPSAALATIEAAIAKATTPEPMR